MAAGQNHVPRGHVPMLSGSGSGTMTDSCWFPQVIRGEYELNTLFGLEWAWNRYGTDTQRNV